MTSGNAQTALSLSRIALGCKPDWLLAIGYGVLVMIFSVLTWAGGFNGLELASIDRQFGWLSSVATATVPEDVVVVGLDEVSLKEFNVPIAALHRQIGGFFEAMAEAKVRAVGLDVVLPELSYDGVQPGLDVALARGILALRAIAPLVLGQTASANGRLRAIHPLYANLTGPDGLGSVLVAKDSDGIVRRFDEHIGVDDMLVPSLPGQLVRRLGANVTSGLIPLFRVNPMRYVPLRDVLSWHASGDVKHLRQIFEGKVVLFGSVLDFDDLHLVALPLSVGDSGGVTHGVFILAAQVRSLLSGDLIREMPLLASFALTLTCTATWWLRPSRSVWLAAPLLLIGVGAMSMQLLVSGWIVPAATWGIAMLVGMTARLSLVSWQAATQRRRMRLAFGGLVSPGVLEEILSGRLHPQLGGERRHVCVLFSDIRSFTALSEHLPPEVVSELLNRYFERMVSCVHRHGGTLDKFIGDGLMAFFGAPNEVPNPSADAFYAASDMLIELEVLNREQRNQNAPVLAIGIGLHYGPAFLGYVGSKDRYDYSAIGDTVNSSARLEGLAKGLGYPIILSDTVRALLPEVTGFTCLGKQAVKGRAEINVFGWKPLAASLSEEVDEGVKNGKIAI